ncbi:uncharacterized protein LOC134537094 isoform X2 [Bacillus rossius redtenbacheri]|uniref:uncharacterized protein LOC134537094 isoform X2 n=1 Tax=Bacillus rossius redtenbacheri TaxID=93214 RepID=UPI002FDDDF2E
MLFHVCSAKTFVEATGKEVHCGNIEAVSSKEKSKFPQDFFPECKWSRKGFLRTRWNLNGTVFDLINIHLFHDASNFVSMESFPSVYCKNRRRALEHTLDRFHNDSNGIAPFFLFGDFNFRTDSQGVVQKLAAGLSPVRVQGVKNTDHTKLQYRDDASEVVLSLGKKEFCHRDHQTVFYEDDAMWLKEFDHELEPFEGRLFEFPIGFPPSYPFEENEKGAKHYMQTRCPSWCDRIVLSSTAKSLVRGISDSSSVEYGIIGSDTCMGDHKPVYLKLDLMTNAGTVKCCSLLAGEDSPLVHPCSRYLPENAWPCTKSMTLNTDHLFVPDSRKPVTLFEAISINVDSENHLLLPAAPFEPYTPESVDTPSLSPSLLHLDQFQDAVEERLSRYSSLQADCCDDCDGKAVTVPRKKFSQGSFDDNADYPMFRWFASACGPAAESVLVKANTPEIVVHDSDGCYTVQHLGLPSDDAAGSGTEEAGRVAPVVSVESLSDSVSDGEGPAAHDAEVFGRCRSDPSLNGRSPRSRTGELAGLRAAVSCGEEWRLAQGSRGTSSFGTRAVARPSLPGSPVGSVRVPDEPRGNSVSPGPAVYPCRSLVSLAHDELSQKQLSNNVVSDTFANSRSVFCEPVMYPDVLRTMVPNNNDDFCTKETSKYLGGSNSTSRRKSEAMGDGEVEFDSIPLKHFEEKTVIASLPSPEETDVVQVYGPNKHRRFSCCCVN